MIDDIWERINLVKMGIPPPDDQNESKVVFTNLALVWCYKYTQKKKILRTCWYDVLSILVFCLWCV